LQRNLQLATSQRRMVPRNCMHQYIRHLTTFCRHPRTIFAGSRCFNQYSNVLVRNGSFGNRSNLVPGVGGSITQLRQVADSRRCGKGLFGDVDGSHKYSGQDEEEKKRPLGPVSELHTHVPNGIQVCETADKQVNAVAVQSAALVKLNNVGLTRGDRPLEQILASSILGGSFLCFGASMYVLLGGGSAEVLAAAPGIHKIASALIFPIGLSLIVVTGADLLTSNMMYSTLPFASKDSRRAQDEKLHSLVRLWGASFAGNLVACTALAYTTSFLFTGTPMGSFAAGIALKKTTGTLLATFCKAVGANWLVNVAVFMAATTDNMACKQLLLWMPITTFVALGLEHCVANMYLLPLGFLCGADIGGLDFLRNMVPAIAGNAVGAGVFVSWLHWKMYNPPQP